jgi:hypothetical protein
MVHVKFPTVPELLDEQCWVPPVRGGPEQLTTVLKLAVTVRSAVRVTMQVAPLPPSQPVQPAKVEPESAVAVRVTVVPEGTLALQALPQSMAPPATEPVPVPSSVTASV